MADGEARVPKESKAQRVERIKRSKDGLDVWDDLVRYSRLGYDAVDPEDLERFKWYGLYHQKPKTGQFMMRLRLPNGAVQAHQVQVVADLVDRYAHGYCDVTTRQNLQLHYLTVEDLPTIFTRLAAVGLSTMAACGDNPRNIVGCPVHGVDRHELLDARPLVDQVNRLYVGNRAFSNLPRKFKVSISGCGLRCAQPEINDIGLSAIRRGDQLGYELAVGGGLSTVPRLAVRLPVFLEPWQVEPVCAAIAALFRDHGDRTKRTHARLKFVVEEWGAERFLEELQSRLPFTLDGDLPPAPALPDERDHLGIHPQRQEGFHYLGLATRYGRLTAAQLREVADLAVTHGDRTVRFTNNQNLILTGVPTARVDEVARRAADAQLPADADVWQRNFVTCTGTQFCNLAITATKEAPGADSPAERILSHLQQELAGFQHFVRLSYNGCPNSCGQHWIADVGLQGVLLKDASGTQVEGAQVTIGGGLGRSNGFGHSVAVRLPLAAVPAALVRLFSRYDEDGVEDESFRDWAARVGDDAVAAALRG